MSRTVVNLRDDLVKAAQRLTGIKKKVEIVNLALEEFVRLKEARKILDLAGKVKWVGNLKEMRRDRKIDFGAHFKTSSSRKRGSGFPPIRLY